MVGLSVSEEKKLDTCHVVPNCYIGMYRTVGVQIKMWDMVFTSS